MFNKVKAWREAGMASSASLVLAYVAEFGLAPAGVIASACNVSERSVYQALSKARKAGLALGLQDPSGHEHVHRHHGEKKEHCENPQSAAQDPAVVGPESAALATLVGLGIYPSTARNLIRDHGLDQVERQLKHHEAREAMGFRYDRAPGAYLYRAIKQDLPGPWAPPPGLVEDAERKQAEISARPVARPEHQEKQQHLTRQQALGVLPMFARSSNRAVRDQARFYARLYALALPPGSLAATEADQDATA